MAINAPRPTEVDFPFYTYFKRGIVVFARPPQPLCGFA